MTTARMTTARPTFGRLIPYLVLGIAFGILATKSEVVSWYRIQEMFRFQSFHMHGILGSAVLVAGVSVRLIKSFNIKSLSGEDIVIPPKQMDGIGTRYWLGGAFFGMGWALTGACPGPLFALVGSGISVYLVAIAAAIAGTYTYGVLRPRLPH